MVTHKAHRHRFPGPVKIFHELVLPETATPAGYAALIDAYGLRAPLPLTLAATGERHIVRTESGWHIFTPRHAPEPNLEAHLTFALKHEGLDLAVLKHLFVAVGAAEIEAIVRAKPTGRYSRRIWFLYEWLLGSRLDLPDATNGPYEPVVDPKLQWAISGEASHRHRVKNNLPGTPGFCPLVFRTKALDNFAAMNLASRAQEVVADVPKDILARTAAFLLLKDSRSSFAIEGESPSHDRIRRWGRAIGESGRRPLELEELLRLQAIVIGEERFVRLGLRKEGGFVGEHDRDARTPIPDHISAKPQDLQSLVNGMVAFDRGAALSLDAVIAAAVLAFGFVYAHPFMDGNGRIHRYLIHHVLAQRGFNPAGVVFPVSASILARIAEYRAALESYSVRLLPMIEWQPTKDGNVQVLNETADFYRYFDATPHAEFLYNCVRQTIEEDLPRETEFLKRYDQFRTSIETILEMPTRTIDQLFRFLHQNAGHLSKRARGKEFRLLKEDEVAAVEAAYFASFTAATIERPRQKQTGRKK
ncbi:Fic family protein [Geomobilimonas luticola]|uniref:Fic family protein n=1 Tax=Geomobilimonas luticola TaxID=1114878 RepID=A0ABS5SI24_9BACT|nr:Fic family protein [Geomobilimonas luticola]MBT0654284.1 Fic family protein [Geomobilimonas luticola]